MVHVHCRYVLEYIGMEYVPVWTGSRVDGWWSSRRYGADVVVQFQQFQQSSIPVLAVQLLFSSRPLACVPDSRVGVAPAVHIPDLVVTNL
jgi:hypothetical protein